MVNSMAIDGQTTGGPRILAVIWLNYLWKTRTDLSYMVNTGTDGLAAGGAMVALAIVSTYRKTSNISRTLVSNKIVDNSDVVGASPVGAAPTTSSFST